MRLPVTRFNPKTVSSSPHTFAFPLAGGSSRWYFVADYCKEILKLEEKQLTQNREPYAAIAKGIAMLPAIEKEFDDKKQRIQDAMPTFLKEEITPFVEQEMMLCQDKIIDGIMTSLFDREIKPLLEDFRNERKDSDLKAGTMKCLQDAIEKRTNSCQSDIKETIERDLTLTQISLFDTSQLKTQNWFEEEFGLVLSNCRVPVEQPIGTDTPVSKQTAITDSVLATVTALAAILAVKIYLVIMAALAADPSGTGGICVLVTSILILGMGIVMGREKARKLVDNNLPIPTAILYRVALTDSQIQKIRKATAKKLYDDMKSVIETITSNIKIELERAIQQEVNRLNILNVTQE
jgi:hypothetical protein